MCTEIPAMSLRFAKPVSKCLLMAAMGAVMLAEANAAPLPTLEQTKSEAVSQAAPSGGPLHMVVSLKEQKLNLYRGSELVEVTPISSGKTGHATPTGVFSILEKRKKHFSNLYDNAPMPFMQRLTWSGIALHEGKLPGYPASHGCVRLPHDFAKSIFSQTDRGMHVVITNEVAQPQAIRHLALIQPHEYRTDVASLSGNAAEDPLRGTMDVGSKTDAVEDQVSRNPHFDKPLRMIVSLNDPREQSRSLQRMLNDLGFDAGPVDGVIGRKTRAALRLFQEGYDLPVTGNLTEGLIHRLYREAGYDQPQNATLRVRRNFRDVYEASVHVANPEREIGTHVFTALDFAEGDLSVDWIGLSAEGERGGTSFDILDRLEIPVSARAELSKMLTPGSSLIMTDRGYARNTGLGTDFVVVTR